MGVRIDKILFSTLFETPKNYATPTSSIVIPADNIPNGNTVNYSASIPYTRGGTSAHVYLDGNDVKRMANAGTALADGEVYQYVGFENADVFVEYDSDSINVTISIFNGTGGAIVLISQTITVSAVQYDMPITAI